MNTARVDSEMATTTALNGQVAFVKDDAGQVVAAVMSFARYQELMEKLDNQEDIIAALETELRITRGEETVTSWEAFEIELSALDAAEAAVTVDALPN